MIFCEKVIVVSIGTCRREKVGGKMRSSPFTRDGSTYMSFLRSAAIGKWRRGGDDMRKKCHLLGCFVNCFVSWNTEVARYPDELAVEEMKCWIM